MTKEERKVQEQYFDKLLKEWLRTKENVEINQCNSDPFNVVNMTYQRALTVAFIMQIIP